MRTRGGLGVVLALALLAFVAWVRTESGAPSDTGGEFAFTLRRGHAIRGYVRFLDELPHRKCAFERRR